MPLQYWFIAICLLFNTWNTAEITAQEVPAQTQHLIPEYFANVYSGVLWKHSPKLKIQTGQQVWSQEIGFQLQTTGTYDWQVAHRYPTLGASVLFVHLGTQAHGTIYTFLPHIALPIIRRPRYNALFRMGLGAAYVSKPHNSATNPIQNALGSHWNACVQFRGGMQIRLSQHWRIEAGGALSHFSNGSYELPNFGINVPGGFAQLTYTPQKIRTADFMHRTFDPKVTGRRLGLLWTMGMGRSEYIALDGPKYTIWSSAMAATWRLRRFNRAAAGVDWEYNSAIYAWGLHALGFQTREAARQGATRWAVFVADEFLIGPIGIWLQPSLHIGSSNVNRLTLGRNYNKLSIRYYLPPIPHTSDTRVFVGMTLKAYGAIAEYFSVNMGGAW